MTTANSTTDYSKATLPPTATLADALESLNATGYKIVMVVDNADHLLGLISDLDSRQFLLKAPCLNTPVTEVMNPAPKTLASETTRDQRLTFFKQHGIDAAPIVDGDNKVVGMTRLRDVTIDAESTAVDSPMLLMAGGFGKRLWPLTKTTPKPLLKVGEKPILGHILDNLDQQQFKNIHISLHYQAEQFEHYLDAEYQQQAVTTIKEDSPLGTAGALKLSQLEDQTEPIFVMNADILTKMDFGDMLSWHRSHGNTLTLASRHFTQQVPFGVLQCNGQMLAGIEEKPKTTYNINAGIYLIEPRALAYIPRDTYFDMPQLINALLLADETVGTYPISESWVDIGEHGTYESVQQNSTDYVDTQPAATTELIEA